MGRNEKNALGDRDGGERQRHADGVRGIDERGGQTVVAMALLAILDAELDAEVDPEPDEQHHERDRNHVERADHHQTERRRDGEPDEQRDEHGDDHASRAQREPQDHQHDDEGDRCR